MDGGTIELDGIDEKGEERTISLIQSAFVDSWLSGIPGRLYLDENPVPVRSELEKQVIAILRLAALKYSSIVPVDTERIELSPNVLILGDDIKLALTRDAESNLSVFRDQVVAEVEAEKYVSFAAKVDSLKGAPNQIGFEA